MPNSAKIEQVCLFPTNQLEREELSAFYFRMGINRPEGSLRIHHQRSWTQSVVVSRDSHYHFRTVFDQSIVYSNLLVNRNISSLSSSIWTPWDTEKSINSSAVIKVSDVEATKSKVENSLALALADRQAAINILSLLRHS